MCDSNLDLVAHEARPVRRLAVQSRDDAYSSLRDYQTVHTAQGIRVTGREAGAVSCLLLQATLVGTANTDYVAVGGFLFPSSDCEVSIQLEAGGPECRRTFRLRRSWNRVGVICDAPGSSAIKTELSWPTGISLDIWGFTGGRVDLPESIVRQGPGVRDLQASHLAPEAFYLPHDAPLALDVDSEAGPPIHLSEGSVIQLKKCSYCGRQLPLDMANLGALSFHKHNAKVTNHQNECRSCKKWRINDGFNPMRTTDQLHESSVITRERKLFLREPEILQLIKQRTGAGLKSQIWNRFGRKCFNCDKALKLSQVQLDHTRPLAYLWPMDEHATCLCAKCNNQKKEKFPVDFYSDVMLMRLSEICGLPIDELRLKALNQTELDRLLADLPAFARTWEARTFAATARKVQEIRPDINLYAILASQDRHAFVDLMARLSDRPESVLGTE